MKNLFRSALLLLCCTAAIGVSAQVPVFSSYPSAATVIFLDFDGQTVNGTSWNSTGPIFCDNSGLTTAQMTEIFNRVAEDYRPFTLNITTDSTKYFAAPANKRMRVIVSQTYQWYGSGAGGVAFVNSFTWGDNTPCFIFSSLLNFNTKNIAEACAHEAGHTLGLRHQSTYDTSCNKVSDYNYGQGTGEIGWAPIMGVGYYQNFTLWHNGPNSLGCNVMQNDLSVITSATNGISFRPDDYTSAFNTATNAPFTNNFFSINGVIEQNTDQDMFKFTMASLAEFKLTGIPYNVGTGDAGSNLDMQVTLYNSAQTSLGTYNPSTLLNTIIDTTLAAGTYYVKVEGKGNIYAPNYASLGSYALQGENIINGTLPLHRLELKGNFRQDQHLLNWVVEADEVLTEQVLEVSSDGRYFTALANPALADRAYTYRPSGTGTLLYRLSVRFDNNSHYYSNVVAIKSSTGTKPKLVSNVITSNSFSIASPGNYSYTLFDMTGKTISQGKITNGMNTITPQGMSSGMYLVRFSDGIEQWTDKLIKQ
jgi:hypothetical protein